MRLGFTLTSAWIMLEQELFQRLPSSAHPHHDRAAEDTNQAKLLGVTELREEGGHSYVNKGLMSTHSEA